MNTLDTRMIPLGVLCLLLFLAITAKAVMGAQTSDDTWNTPINLSQSGVASNLVVTTDNNGQVFLLWQDAIAGFMMTTQEDTTWTNPQNIRLPFSEPPLVLPGEVDESEDFQMFQPNLKIDDNDVWHGWWLNQDVDLLYSQTVFTDVANLENWSEPQALASSVLGFETTIGENGRIHLAYIQTKLIDTDAPGIYYRFSDDNGLTWSLPIPLYLSDYLRNLPLDQTNLKIVTGVGENLYIVWDNPALDTIYFSRSSNNGGSWSTPIVVDQRQPEDSFDSAAPSQIDIVVTDEVIHLTWLADHEGQNCGQYHQISNNGGQTWETAQPVFSDAVDCPERGQLIVGNEGLVGLLVTLRGEAYLYVWDGEQWSEPEVQKPLVSFLHPDTNQSIRFDCWQTAVKVQHQLFVFGCGTSSGKELSVQDIWVQSRQLGTIADWSSRFAPTPVWNDPVTVADSTFTYLSPESTADQTGKVHVVWSETGAHIAGDRFQEMTEPYGKAIYYAALEVDRWSSARPVLTSPQGKAEQPAIADFDGTVFVVWSGGEAGEIYFSRALAERAVSVSEWQSPVLLSSPLTAGQAPDIAAHRDGTLYVAYAVPLNEERGIYLTSSTDNGESWSEAFQVFDGATSGWTMVDAPELIITEDRLHLLWLHRPLQSNPGNEAVFYANSKDRGETWSSPVMIAEGDLVWHETVGIGSRLLHQAWLQKEGDQLHLWHNFSEDNGFTWSEPSQLSNSTAMNGPADLFVDASSKPHIIQLVENSEDLLLQDWQWDGIGFELGETLVLPENVLSVGGVTAVVTTDNLLQVIYTAVTLDDETEQRHSTLMNTLRVEEAPLVSPTPLPTLTPVLPTATSQPTPAPLSTPTRVIVSSTDNDDGDTLSPFVSLDPTNGILISVIPAAIIVLIAFIAGLRIAKNR